MTFFQSVPGISYQQFSSHDYRIIFYSSGGTIPPFFKKELVHTFPANVLASTGCVIASTRFGQSQPPLRWHSLVRRVHSPGMISLSQPGDVHTAGAKSPQGVCMAVRPQTAMNSGSANHHQQFFSCISFKIGRAADRSDTGFLSPSKSLVFVFEQVTVLRARIAACDKNPLLCRLRPDRCENPLFFGVLQFFYP